MLSTIVLHPFVCYDDSTITTNWENQGCVNVIVFSPSGDTLASGSDDGKVRLWDPYTFKCLRTMKYVLSTPKGARARYTFVYIFAVLLGL